MVYISIRDLMIFLAVFILFCLLVVVGIFFIMTLNHLNKLLTRANKLVESNEESLHKTLALLPETVQNVNEVVANVKMGLDQVGDTVEAVETALTETVAAVSGNTQNFFSLVNTVSGIAKIIFEVFSKPSSKE